MTEICGGGYNINTVLFQNMLVPQNDILEIPKTVKKSSEKSDRFRKAFLFLT